MLTDAAAATPMPVDDSSSDEAAASGSTLAVAPCDAPVPLSGSDVASMSEPATVNAQTSPLLRASTRTPSVTSIEGAELLPGSVNGPPCGSSSPITARVLRFRSLMATETPRPIASPLATPPAQVTLVVRSPAYTRASRPVTIAPLASCASVSLVWPTYSTVPPNAKSPPDANDCARLTFSSASSALMLKPPSWPLYTFAPSSTIACVVLFWTLMKSEPPAPPLDPPVPNGLRLSSFLVSHCNTDRGSV